MNNTSFQSVGFEEVEPDEKNNWINITHNDFDELVPMFDRDATDKNAKTLRGTIFSRFSMGLQPKCDEWIYDKRANDLKDKMLFFTAAFNAAVEKHNFPNEEIKWHRELVKLANKSTRLEFEPKRIIRSIYRPFSIEEFYNDRRIISMNFLQQDIFTEQNKSIAVSGIGSNKPFACLANALATALVAAGVFAPAIAFLYGISRPAPDAFQISMVTVACIGGGALLHLYGRRMLGRLRE